MLAVGRQPLGIGEHGDHRRHHGCFRGIEVLMVEVVECRTGRSAQDHDEHAIDIVLRVGRVEIGQLFFERGQIDRFACWAQGLHGADLVREGQIRRRADDLEGRVDEARGNAVGVLHHQLRRVPTHVLKGHVVDGGFALDEAEEGMPFTPRQHQCVATPDEAGQIPDRGLCRGHPPVVDQLVPEIQVIAVDHVLQIRCSDRDTGNRTDARHAQNLSCAQAAIADSAGRRRGG